MEYSFILTILPKVDGITAKQAETLYNMDYDGWISSCTRNSLLWGKCAGNVAHINSFNYFGTPDTYKVVIINNDTGEIKITDVIHRTDFQSNITIDIDTMQVVKHPSSSRIIKTFTVALILTVFVEIIIALIMKIKDIKIIFIANLITNIILQVALIYIPLPYLITFIIMEILVILSEYLIYKKHFSDIAKSKVIYYTVIANIISSLLTFIIK